MDMDLQNSGQRKQYLTKTHGKHDLNTQTNCKTIWDTCEQWTDD